MKNIISFSLYGEHSMYRIGALENARLAQSLYPGWTCRFYVSQEIPLSLVKQLKEYNAEVVHKERKKLIDGMFWRMLPIDDDDLDHLIVRDSDSRFTEREAAAVHAWCISGKDFHVMRDHPAHNHVIMGGLWGVKGGVLHNISGMIRAWRSMRMLTGRKSFHQRGFDQVFLEQMVYPFVKHSILIHSDLVRFQGEEVVPFPLVREMDEFVGQRITEHHAPEPREIEILQKDGGQLRTYRRPYSLLPALLLKYLSFSPHL